MKSGTVPPGACDRPRRRRWPAWVLCGATLAAATLLATVWAAAAPVPAPRAKASMASAPPEPPAPSEHFPDLWAGQQVILNKGCTHCHGMLAPGGRQGPDLLRTARGKNSAELLADMWNHVPQMVGALPAGEQLPSLTAEQLRDLVGYLSFISYLGDPGNAERGEARLAELPCLGCHDLARPGKIGPALVSPRRAASPVGLVADLWNHYTEMRAALDQKGLRWFPWSGDLITDLSCFLSSQVPPGEPSPLLAPGDPSEGSRAFGTLGCVKCHGAASAPPRAAFDRRTNGQSAAENGAALLRHLPSMGARGFRPVSEKTMADLMAYLSLAGTQLAGGDPAAGGAVFERQRCAGCHALPGRKSGIGPDVRSMPPVRNPYQVAALMFQHAHAMKMVTELRHVPWPQMKSDELLDLYAFLATQTHR